MSFLRGTNTTARNVKVVLGNLGFRHRGLNRFHRGYAAYIPYILTRDVAINVAKPLPVLFQA